MIWVILFVIFIAGLGHYKYMRKMQRHEILEKQKNRFL